MRFTRWTGFALTTALAAVAAAQERGPPPPMAGMRPPMGPPPADRQAPPPPGTNSDGATTDDTGAADDAPPPECGGGHGGGSGAGGGAGRHRGPKPGDPRGLARLLAAAADTDASGDVSADEIAAFLESLGADESGAISVETLVALFPPPPEDAPEDAAERLAERLATDLDHDADGAVEIEDLEWFFSILDADGDGAASADELTPPKPLKGRARRAALALARAADADDSRDVSAEEWQAFLDGLVVDEETGAVSLDDLAAKLNPRHSAPEGADTTKRDAKLVKGFDRDGDGVVEVEDLQAVFDELDFSADGALTKREAKAKR